MFRMAGDGVRRQPRDADGDHLDHRRLEGDQPADHQGADDPGLPGAHRARRAVPARLDRADRAVRQRALLPQPAQRRQRADRDERLGRLAGAAAAAVRRAVGAGASSALLALHTVVIPFSFNAIDEMSKRIHADFISNFATAGAFNQLEAGFIFHYRERGADGSLRGVFIQDRRNPQEISTFIAEVGNLVEKNDDVYLVLSKGSAQRPRGAGDTSDRHLRRLRHRPQPVPAPRRGRRQAAPAQPRHAGAAEVRSRRSRREAVRGRGARRAVRPADQPALRAGGGPDRLRRAGRGAHDAAEPRAGDPRRRGRVRRRAHLRLRRRADAARQGRGGAAGLGAGRRLGRAARRGGCSSLDVIFAGPATPGAGARVRARR